LRWLGVIAALALGAPVLSAGPAAADPIAQKEAQAAALAHRIALKGERVSELAEQVNRAQLRAAELDTRMQQSRDDLQSASARAAVVNGVLRTQAIATYIHGAARAATARVGMDGVQLAVENRYVDSMAATQQQALDAVRASKTALADQSARYEQAKKDAADALAKVTASKRAATRAVQDDDRQLRRLTGELGAMVAAEQTRMAEAEATEVRAMLLARFASGAASRSVDGRTLDALASSSFVTAVASPGAASAVAAAQSQLGKPYRYAGAGPDSFDCSGLTMWAWGPAGVSLPHSAAAQYGVVTHIPLSVLQPGDLVFFGGDIHHVGIYVGDGQMIEAPHTGANVRYASIYRRDLVGAGRP
jgi:cell wall-associated NlpC family hydrolase